MPDNKKIELPTNKNKKQLIHMNRKPNRKPSRKIHQNHLYFPAPTAIQRPTKSAKTYDDSVIRLTFRGRYISKGHLHRLFNSVPSKTGSSFSGELLFFILFNLLLSLPLFNKELIAHSNCFKKLDTHFFSRWQRPVRSILPSSDALHNGKTKSLKVGQNFVKSSDINL